MVARFAYKAIDNGGKEVFGIVDAESQNEAMTEVGRLGLFLTDLHAAGVGDELRSKWIDQKEQRRSEEEKRHEQMRARHPRQRLVVRYQDGRTLYGVCFAMNPADSGFHLDTVEADGRTTGKTVPVRFEDLKAVFQVKSFDGNFDKSMRHQPQFETGVELVVEFKDGEVIRGFTQRSYRPEHPRFYLIPHEKDTNNISILVQRSAVAEVCTPEEHKQKLDQKKAELHDKAGATDLSQEETLGDFYFETKNYAAALEQYQAAQRKYPGSTRLRRKVLATMYNIGVQHIKRRDYPSALEYMERVLHSDPGNTHAKKKIHQLKKVLERETP
jgi:tetratricopeptide (TPR) repeat protein